MTNFVTNTKWRRRDPGDSAWADFEDAYVVFHHPSGRTHLLNQATRDILELLGDRALTAEDVAAELRVDVADVPLEDYMGRVHSVLRRLEHLGFVKSV
jgi:PqqD family protein of HPr-rel-A system